MERGFIAGFGQREIGIRAEGVDDVPTGVSPRFFLAVTPRYFETVGMSVIQGRPFTNQDSRASAPVVIINRRLASSLWPGRDAVGRRIRLGISDSLPWRTIVGIVNDIGDSASSRVSTDAYVPFVQSPLTVATLLVGAAGDPKAMVKPIREVARSVDPDLPLLDIMTTSEAHARAWGPYRAIAATMSVFGVLALILACVGLYGLVAYAAEQRTREIGVRIALGATRVDVVRLVSRRGLQLVAVGVAFGIAAATLVLPKVIRGLLFGASGFDPVVFAAASVLLVLVAAGANYLPALRATRVDPMVALRSE